MKILKNEIFIQKVKEKVSISFEQFSVYEFDLKYFWTPRGEAHRFDPAEFRTLRGHKRRQFS